MDFFHQEQRARQRTTRLVVLFVLAVLAIIATLYVVIALILIGIGGVGAHPAERLIDAELEQGQQEVRPPGLWQPELLLLVGGGVIVVVAAGTIYKIVEMGGGGRTVAESLGARLIAPGADVRGDADLQRLLNVVEEMAIASGVPVPPVYVLENERGINAFAAGFSPASAVITVTRGAITELNRDQLQGVIGHEFSHILNGDMRLNIRLIGVLGGILLLGLLGAGMMRVISAGGSSDDDSIGAIIVIFLIGLALFVIGYIGVFFGNLIKAAVSRQREFLADASSVQFTRNPEGIGGALKRIGGLSAGSLINNAHAGQVSHMFFSQSFTSDLGGLTATHPPLKERIRRVLPDWDGKFDTSRPHREAAVPPVQGGTPGMAALGPLGALTGALGAAGGAMGAGAAGGAAGAVVLTAAMGQIGQPSAAQLEEARQVLAQVPGPVLDAAHEPFGARVVLYAMLIHADAAIRQRQMQYLQAHDDAHTLRLLDQLLPQIAPLKPRVRLALTGVAVGTLRQLAQGQYEAFTGDLDALIDADGKVSLFEWMLRHLVQRSLADHFTAVTGASAMQRFDSAAAPGQCATILAALARVGAQTAIDARHAFALGWSALGLPAQLMPESATTYADLDKALAALAQAPPTVKRGLIAACATCINADRNVTENEAELFRAVAAALGCPIPPILA